MVGGRVVGGRVVGGRVVERREADVRRDKRLLLYQRQSCLSGSGF